MMTLHINTYTLSGTHALTALISANAGMPCRPFRLDITGLLPDMGYKIKFLILGYNLRVSVKYIWHGLWLLYILLNNL